MYRITPKIDGKEISNFTIALHRVVNVHCNPQDDSTPYLEANLTFNKGKPSEKVRIPLSKIDATQWETLDCRASFIPDIAPAKANRYITAEIKSSLDAFTAVDVYKLSSPGMYKIEGKPFFCTGVEVIRPPADAEQAPEIECAPLSQRLDIDPDLSEEEAAAEVLNLISLFPNPGRIILAQVLVSLMWQAYEDIGKRPSFCVILHGHTGTQKTTVASFMTQIYNRAEGIKEPTRLSTSQASAVELLLDVTDQVQVFDDLFPAASNQVRKKQEEVLSEITRYIGDGTVPARIKGSNVRTGHPRCGVLFTGEYLVGEGSDAARLLPVEMTKPDTSALSYFQERPLIISTFYRNFIVWFVENYDEVVARLKDWMKEYRNFNLGLHDRLRETHFFLNSAYTLFLFYCVEKGVLYENEIKSLKKNFLELLLKLVLEQNERVSPAAQVSSLPENVLARIKDLYQSGRIRIAKNKRQFNDTQYDGVTHKGYLCLRPQAISSFFQGYDSDDIARKLYDQDALIKERGKLKKKISDTGGKYFYCIPLDLL